jgi:hypothetical protein
VCLDERFMTLACCLFVCRDFSRLQRTPCVSSSARRHQNRPPCVSKRAVHRHGNRLNRNAQQRARHKARRLISSVFSSGPEWGVSPSFARAPSRQRGCRSSRAKPTRARAAIACSSLLPPQHQQTPRSARPTPSRPSRLERGGE